MPQVGDERVSFAKGWFQTTLPGFANGFTPRSRLVVHNDSDLYSSTLFALASRYTLLVPGAVVILDDFSHTTHVSVHSPINRSAFWRSVAPSGDDLQLRVNSGVRVRLSGDPIYYGSRNANRPRKIHLVMLSQRPPSGACPAGFEFMCVQY